MASDGALNLSVTSAVDYATPSTQFITSPTSTPSGAAWDVAAWDSAAWAGGETISNSWLPANHIGRTISVRCKTRTQGQSVSWYATNYLYKVGGLV